MSDFYIKDGDSYTLNPKEAEKTFDVPIVKQISMADLENIIITALEGGIGYWAILDNRRPEWKARPKGMPLAQYALGFIAAGSALKFNSVEGDDDSGWFLTRDKLLTGIGLNIKEHPSESDLDDLDAEGADRIIQYALFGKIIYG